jgi:hypothetical protein
LRSPRSRSSRSFSSARSTAASPARVFPVTLLDAGASKGYDKEMIALWARTTLHAPFVMVLISLTQGLNSVSHFVNRMRVRMGRSRAVLAFNSTAASG